MTSLASWQDGLIRCLACRPALCRVSDPRVERTRHRFGDILLLALCATLAGAENFADMEDRAKMKAGWLRTFLGLPGGTPSHDTIERVFRRLDPEALLACFLRWLESKANAAGAGRHVAKYAKYSIHLLSNAKSAGARDRAVTANPAMSPVK